jgi:nickel-dependent lactate racemase
MDTKKSKISIKTGVWYGDALIDLPVPSGWEVKVLWPATPPPLTTEEMAVILEQPVGRVSVRELCKGKSRPLIIVDDLNRPTPVSEIMPLLIRDICAADIDPGNITILMATGTHGRPRSDDILKKVGKEAAQCRLLIHDCFADVVKIGATTCGTPVFVNKAIMESDAVIGVGGIYPNHTAGFGGGSKLAVGVLGIRTIYHLHFRNKAINWGNTNIDNKFRMELDEIAEMIGMEMNVSLIIDANRNIIKIYCGDQRKYFPEAVSFYHKTFGAPQPDDDVDVVISNAYPNDLSLIFARMKGFVPLNNCRRSASRISIASCNEGLGLHHIWPFVNVPRFHKVRHVLRVLSVLSVRDIINKMHRILRRALMSRFKPQGADNGKPSNPVWLYRTGDQAVKLPHKVPGINITSEWREIIEAVSKEQPKQDNLRVLVYPCSFLQVIKD